MGLAAPGPIFSVFASAAKTEADIRGWDGLPDKIMLATGKCCDSSFEPKLKIMKGASPVCRVADAVPTMPSHCQITKIALFLP
jgi:hypothetical protein